MTVLFANQQLLLLLVCLLALLDTTSAIKECLYSEAGCPESAKAYCIDYECDDSCQSVSAFVNNQPTTLYLRCKPVAGDQFDTRAYKNAGCTDLLEENVNKCTPDCRLSPQGFYFTCNPAASLRQLGVLFVATLLIAATL